MCFKETVQAPMFDFVHLVLRSYDYNMHGFYYVYLCFVIHFY